jgi:hypothetical protein
MLNQVPLVANIITNSITMASELNIIPMKPEPIKRSSSITAVLPTSHVVQKKSTREAPVIQDTVDISAFEEAYGPTIWESAVRLS